MDIYNSENAIGQIVNLSQRLNGILWEKLSSGKPEDSDFCREIYHDICILSVLSGIEIDKAKRNFGVDCKGIMKELSEKYIKDDFLAKPQFFQCIEEIKAKKNHRGVSGTFRLYKTPMDLILSCVNDRCDLREGREGKLELLPISALFGEVSQKTTSTDYARKNAIMKIYRLYEKKLKFKYFLLGNLAESEQEIIQEDIMQMRQERDIEIQKMIGSENVIRLLVQWCEKQQEEDWLFYSAILQENNPLVRTLLQKGTTSLPELYEMPNGTVNLCGYTFGKR